MLVQTIPSYLLSSLRLQLAPSVSLFILQLMFILEKGCILQFQDIFHHS